jgi:hypothetical protein
VDAAVPFRRKRLLHTSSESFEADGSDDHRAGASVFPRGHERNGTAPPSRSAAERFSDVDPEDDVGRSARREEPPT